MMDALVVDTVLGPLPPKPQIQDLNQDRVLLKWYECAGKIIHAKSEKGREVAFRRLKENEPLHHLDVVFCDAENIIWVEIEPTESIVLQPKTMQEMGRIGYEIGNKHIPLFMVGEELLLPFEKPIFTWLEDAGFAPKRERRILDHSLKNTLSTEVPHHHHHHD